MRLMLLDSICSFINIKQIGSGGRINQAPPPLGATVHCDEDRRICLLAGSYLLFSMRCQSMLTPCGIKWQHVDGVGTELVNF